MHIFGRNKPTRRLPILAGLDVGDTLAGRVAKPFYVPPFLKFAGGRRRCCCDGGQCYVNEEYIPGDGSSFEDDFSTEKDYWYTLGEGGWSIVSEAANTSVSPGVETHLLRHAVTPNSFDGIEISVQCTITSAVPSAGPYYRAGITILKSPGYSFQVAAKKRWDANGNFEYYSAYGDAAIYAAEYDTIKSVMRDVSGGDGTFVSDLYGVDGGGDNLIYTSPEFSHLFPIESLGDCFVHGLTTNSQASTTVDITYDDYYFDVTYT